MQRRVAALCALSRRLRRGMLAPLHTLTDASILSWECCCRAGCSAEEFEGLVQRNMAANCGMDYRAAGELIASIVCVELKHIWASEAGNERTDGRRAACQPAARAKLPRQCGKGESDTEQRSVKEGCVVYGHGCEAEHDSSDPRIVLTAKHRLRQALPMLEGLLAGRHCDESNGRGLEMPVHTCEHEQSGASNYYASNLSTALQFGKHETAMGPLRTGSTCEEGFGGLNDEHFWQYLRGLLYEVQRCAHASKPALRPQQSLSKFCDHSCLKMSLTRSKCRP